MPAGPHPLLRARWFDGRSAEAQPVLLRLEPGARGPSLHLHPLAGGAASARVFGPGAVGWPEAWNPRRAQRIVMVDLRDAGSLEIDDGAQWHAALEAAGGRPGIAQRMQTRWRVFAAVLLLAVIGIWAFYRWGTPWAAAQLSRHVPLSWEQDLSAEAMRELDADMLKPSKLPRARQAGLRALFDELVARSGAELDRYPGYAPVMSLSFRSGIPPNAFALPGGAMVLSDSLVELAAAQGVGDDALAGVLAHEIGHVVHRHTTRMVVEQGVLNVGIGLAMGDVSSIVAMGSTMLTSLAYRRGHETEADCFAVVLMQKSGRPLAPMADLLLAIDRRGDEADGKGRDKGDAKSAKQSVLASLLNSHPDTAERARRMKAGAVQACAAP